jgi:16S rRNA (cytosine967-C5)-methyltransferase
MAAPARHAALEVLRRVSRGGTTLDILDRLEARLADERDRALVHELVLGTLRRRGWLDHVIARLCARPFAELEPAIVEVLRLGAYQLLFLRVAPHAAVSESVELARAETPRAAGFVNAVLRRLQREGPPPEPDAGADPIGWLTTAGSLPRWLAERWLAQLGAERAMERARAALEPPPIFVRLNPRVSDAAERLSAAGSTLKPTDIPECYRLEGGSPGRLAEQGVVYVQDAGSQLVARLAEVRGLWLDACAAPGGKSLSMADAAAEGTRIVAAEASRPRLAVLVRLAARWGASGLWPVAADALAPPFRRAFDGVLLDAPCSGLGTLARNPDIRWRLDSAGLARHAERQRAMLESLANLVRPGGQLVYATCSLEPEETREVVDAFLERDGRFVLAELPPWARRFAVDGRIELDPAKRAGDGFFAARLLRRGDAAPHPPHPPLARAE